MIFFVKFQAVDRKMTAIVYHEPPEFGTGFRGDTYIEGIEEASPTEEITLMMEYENVIWQEIEKALFKMEYGDSGYCL